MFNDAGRLIELELSGNPFGELPIITGDMHLLKVLKEWEVGVSAFKQLKSLCAAEAQLKQWPPQVDRLGKLELMDLSRNALTRAPESIARNNNLTQLDLSHNQLVSIPAEIYGLPLQVGARIYHMAKIELIFKMLYEISGLKTKQ